MGPVIAVCFAVSLMAGPEAPWNPAALPMDKGGVTAVVGNGRLTVGLDARGNVWNCFWPGPGQDNQLAPDRPGQPCAVFFLGLQGQIISTADPAWQAIGPQDAVSDGGTVETRLALPGTDTVLRQTVSVVSSMDVLAIQIGVSGVPGPPGVFWYQDFNPRTARIPEAAWLPAIWPNSADFAAFLVSAPAFRAYQFRPEAPSKAEWAGARRLVQNRDAAQVRRAAASWGTASRAIWVGLASPNRAAGAVCGEVDDAEAPLQQVRQGRIGGSAAAVGDCAVAVELAPEPRGNEYGVTLYLAFGHNAEEVDEHLDTVLRSDFAIPAVQPETQPEQDPEFSRLRALSTLRRALDPESGSVARAPVAEPPQFLVSAEVTAWAALALDYAGQHSEAAAALRFLRTKVRMQSRPGQPKGSLASAYYASGAEAAPHLVLDPSASAWLLSGLWRHGAFLSGPEKQTWFEESWESVRACADFLCQWSSGPGGAPLPAYDPLQGRDASRDEALLHHLMGLNAAIRIDAALSKRSGPSWVRRRDELENQLRSRMLLGKKSALQISPSLPFWLRGAIETDREAVWSAPAVHAEDTAALSGIPFGPRAEWSQDADVDAYAAALTYVAMTVSDGSKSPERPEHENNIPLNSSSKGNGNHGKNGKNGTGTLGTHTSHNSHDSRSVTVAKPGRDREI